MAGCDGICGQGQEGHAEVAGERVGRDAEDGDVVLRVGGDDGGLEKTGRGVGSADDEVGLAAVAEGVEDVSVGEQVALLVDEKGVAEKGVVIAARGRGFVEAVDDRADGGVEGYVGRRMVRGGRSGCAGTGNKQGQDIDCRSAMKGFDQA